MIQTLKAELKLRPTYDELVGRIESQGDPNRPSIEQVIDRKATIFRNNQFGSQFDNIDFLGLKKQEENRAKENLRQAQIRNAGIQQGTSTGLMGIDTTGFVEPSLASGLTTPAEVFDDAVLRPEPTLEEMEEIRRNVRENLSASDDLRRAEEQKALEIIRASMIGDTERYREQVRKQQVEISQMTKNDLSDVHGQVLPAGVPVHSMDAPVQSNQGYPPSLPAPPPQEEDSEEEEELTALVQQVAFTNGFDPDKVFNDDSINYRGLMFQLHVKDLLTPETIELLNKIPTDQKKKQYLVSLMEGLKENDEWDADFNSQKFSRKIKEFKKIRRQVKSKTVEPSAGSSSSSSGGGGIGSAIVGGAKAVGGAVLEAGKEAVKEAVVAGARNAVMSLI